MTKIIGYIHICQIGNWELPFKLIMRAVRRNGLYDATHEIRLGIVNNENSIIDNPIFDDKKFVKVAHDKSSNYERTTLLHMSNASETDPCCAYWYAHTKGIKYFDTNSPLKKNIIQWIRLMCYHNFINWRNAIEKLLTHDTYGCEYFNIPKKHYSGNMWWANSHYIRTIPKYIGEDYYDPEFWLLQRPDALIYNAFSSGYGPGGLYYKFIYIFKKN
jgi:hypothetical protein